MRNRFSLLSRTARTALVFALVLGTTASAAAALFFVYPPFLRPAGRSYSAHAANWWKWALSQPANQSPLLDTTGVHCAKGQTGPVWFLAGSVDGNAVNRSCTMPFGKTIVFPVANAAYFAFLDDAPETRTEEFVRSQVDWIADATNLEVEIDGQPVRNVERFFERSDLFSVTLPANNIYDLPAGFQLSPAADAGYYLAVAPLLGGYHTIHFHAELPDGSEQDVTYNLNVRWF